MARRSRAEQVEANREAILDAAKDHFSRLGYHGASLDAIADAAGFSKGAIYSQFGSKDDLMLAVLERNIARRRNSNSALLALPDDRLGPDDVWRHIEAETLHDRGWQAALIEFRVHASRNPELNDRYRVLHDKTIAGLSELSAAVAERLAIDTRVTARSIAISSFIVGLGLVVEHLVDDDVDAVELVRAISAISPQPATSRSRPR
jgi:AcrR family transcriptional regulator